MSRSSSTHSASINGLQGRKAVGKTDSVLSHRVLRLKSLRAALFAAGLSAVGTLAVACQPAKMPQDMPGPVGCGMRDPRGTSPNTLSMAQKLAYKDNGAVGDVQPNKNGGLDWIYHTTAGSVFGQQEKVTTLTFDAQGLLVATQTEMVSKLGK